MKLIQIILLSTLVIASTANSLAKEDDSGWFVRPTFSLSNLSDTRGDLAVNPDSVSEVSVATDSGFATGLGLGYQYNPNLAVELYWEYRTNDTDSQLADNTVYAGNYASNVFYLNGFYFFDSNSDWTPYVGAGLGWVQEIDLDWEIGDVEDSYSSDGESAFQLFAGTNYRLNSDWDLQLEVRYGNISSVDLSNELSDIPLNGLDYKTTSIQAAFIYRF